MSPSNPEDTVRAFLDAMEGRDLERAQTFLSSDFSMEFPGGGTMRTLKELIGWAKPRYRSVTKQYAQFDAMDVGNGESVVYCFGTLSGIWNNGERFSDIRFIDRFHLSDGKIIGQKVWNDLGEVRDP